MHQIDGSTAFENHFVDYDGTVGTVVSASWLNSVQDEICNVIKAAEIELSKEKNDQLIAAVTKIIENSINQYKAELDDTVSNLAFPEGKEDKKFKNLKDFLERVCSMYIAYEPLK